MRKVPFGTLSAKNLNLVIMGIGLSKGAIIQLERASQKGITLYGSNKLIAQLEGSGLKVKPFADKSLDIVGYPQSGIPAWLSEAITATKPEHLAKLSDARKPVMHAVFTELDNLTGNEVEGSVTFNITDALSKATHGGRIAMTNADQLEAFNEMLEITGNTITPDVYEALAVRNGKMTWEALRNYATSVIDNLEGKVEEAERVLEGAGVTA